MRDVTRPPARTESRMAHMAYHDGLNRFAETGRRSYRPLSQMIEACADTNEQFAVLSVDLDGLKEIKRRCSAIRSATSC